MARCFPGFRDDSEKFYRDPARRTILNQLSSRYCVDHVIAREGSAFLLGKGVLMNPQSVGASGLLVDQACGRFPNYDLVLPTNR